MHFRKRWFAVAAMVVGISAAIPIWHLGFGRPVIDPDDPAQVAVGERVYAGHCASCHGTKLEGQPDWKRRLPSGRLPAPPHDASGHTFEHADEHLIRAVKDGPAVLAGPIYQSDMPGFGDVLSDEEIHAVLAYIKSKWPERLRRAQHGR